MGIHPDRRSVYDYIRVRVARQIRVVVIAAARDHGDARRTEMFDGCLHGKTCSAGTEDNRFSALEIDVARHVGKAREIGVVAVERAVRTADHGVYRADCRRAVGKGRAVRNDDFLVGDGHVYRIPGAARHECADILLGNFEKPVVFVAEKTVQQGRDAVRQRFSEKSRSHIRTRCSFRDRQVREARSQAEL